MKLPSGGLKTYPLVSPPQIVQARNMRVIVNRWIPFPGFLAVNVLGWVFVRHDFEQGKILSAEAYKQLLRHEYTHTLQMRELAYFGFYLWYVMEWIFRFVQHRNLRKAYRNLSFEREAYAHQHDRHYNAKRKPWAFLRYLHR